MSVVVGGFCVDFLCYCVRFMISKDFERNNSILDELGFGTKKKNSSKSEHEGGVARQYCARIFA